MNQTVIELPELLLAGFSFFGDPFQSKGPWSEENAIGLLWQRCMRFWNEEAGQSENFIVNPEIGYEVHIETLETSIAGDFEVFVGFEVKQVISKFPYLVYKMVPASQYALFTLTGEEITSDWSDLIFSGWLKDAAYEQAHPFLIERYDSRYKGPDQLSDSVIEVLLPIQPKA